MTTDFYNLLKEDIIQQSDKLPPLFLAIGSIGVWRLNRDKQRFGSSSSKEQVWDYLQFLNNKIEKDDISQEKLDQIFYSILTERFLKAEMLGRKNSQKKDSKIQDPLKDDQVNPNGAFTILSPPSSDDENDDDDDKNNQKNNFKLNQRVKQQPKQQKNLHQISIPKNDKEQTEQFSEGQIQRQMNLFKQRQEEQQKNQKLIQQLKRIDQKQQNQRRKQLLQEQKAEAICKICYMQIDQDGMYPLDSCEHMYHDQCLKNHIQFAIKEGNFPIKCPETDCGKDIWICDIKQIVNEEMEKKYYQFSFKKYVVEHPNQVSCCPTADCQFHFYWDQKDGEQFNCPQCKKKYCLSCRSDWHEGMSCQEYKDSQNPDENQKKFDTFVKGQNFKKCPHCGYWVERTFGCEYIVCKCGKNFCYLCGKGHKAHFCPDRNKYKDAYAAPVLFGGVNRRPVARRPRAPRKVPAKRAKTPAKRETRATRAKPTPRKKK